MENGKKVGLALGGGGGRGAAHIGILYELEKEKIPIDLIAGTSIGSIVGAFYACGFSLDKISEIFSSMSVSSPLYFRFFLNGVFSSKFVERSCQKYLKDATFRDVKIPFSAVSVDLDSGERLILRDGLLGKALSASCALPLAFTPARIGRRRLVDGALLDNVPVDVVREMGADIVIGIDLGSDPVSEKELTKMSIFGRTFDIMIRKITDDHLCHGDVVIKPDVEEYPVMEFKNFDEIMQKGKEAAQEAMPLIKQAISHHS